MNRFLFLLIGSLVCAGQSVAAPWYQPEGLVEGDTYQLTFVTSAAMSPHNSNIGDYNLFVNNQASLNLELAAFSWMAIASTPTVNAHDNAVVQGPVFNTNGNLVANDATDMWDGNIQNAILYNQFGVEENPSLAVWTGSNSDGTSLGSNFSLGGPWPYYGGLDKKNGQWITWGPWGGGGGLAFDGHIYALSQEITVPSAVPVPAAIWLFGSGILGLIGFSRRKKAAA